ncbi:phosphotransferase [Candidatus Pelagibacter sp.]|uniref:phosphotransferase n=1 Tax=Candidatus Pelagibacter sp. TaxID=2024849 RepID=UPI003F832C33
MKSLAKLKKIKGDASFREFYRNRENKSIIVISKKEKLKNLLIYDAVNKILIKNKILAPNLISENYINNYIEINDFGDQTLFQILKNKKNNKYVIFKKIIKILNKIQLIKDKKVKNFKNKLYKVQEYKNKTLIDETKLFCDWYVPKILSKSKSIQFKKKFRLEIKKLLSKLNYKNVTFVHRDFHVSNLMYYNKKIAVIDSQDALIGNRAYDLASLIDDVRLKTSNELKEKVFKFYIKTNKKIDLEKFKKDFEILSVLRNLKIIGIFMRLAERDNKKKYLKLIPYAWELINHRIKEQNQFNNLMLLLKNNFPKFIR